MAGKSSARQNLRFLLCGLALSGVAALAASCADAINVGGYHDAFAEVCDLVARCYGETYADCPKRVQAINSELTSWLDAAELCTRSCSTIHGCLDFPGMCREQGESCDVSVDCCGFSAGVAACAGGQCCLPFGAGCEPTSDMCCAGQGPCDLETFTCGGAVCAPPGTSCLNDFQCCTGRCVIVPGVAGKVCAEAPCPPVGFECESDADCCKLVCRDGRCDKPPECALLGEGCNAELPCCAPNHKCYTPTGDDGICSPEECIPDNADCFSDDQCCSQLCVPLYNLCGQCQSEPGAVCSDAAPCCEPMFCDGTGHCSGAAPSP